MKRILGIISIVCTVLLIGACSGSKGNASGDYAGTFTTQGGIIFTLNEDSTTVIDFGNGIDYKGTWEIVRSDGEEWANIEFSGNKQYYYLKNGKIYRSHKQMAFDQFGSKVTYQKP